MPTYAKTASFQISPIALRSMSRELAKLAFLVQNEADYARSQAEGLIVGPGGIARSREAHRAALKDVTAKSEKAIAARAPTRVLPKPGFLSKVGPKSKMLGAAVLGAGAGAAGLAAYKSHQRKKQQGARV
ncbi:MAG: hypothetical protein DRQ64_00135 [Gammaproteobacteria bacterium]|nr:MAG: hypothetical protein DRQ64_00135 [Gammaproteobacteria bacterium]